MFIWDVQTGVVVKVVSIQGLGEIAFSQDQSTITRVLGGVFRTYDRLEGALLCEGELLPSPDYELGPRWAYKGALRFATFFRNGQRLMIEIRELRPASDPPILVVESFPRAYHKGHPYGGRFSFSPVSFHASFVTKVQVVILNVRDSRILLQDNPAQPHYRPPGCFSPNGCFFACSTLEKSEIYVWKNTPDGYVSWSILRPRLPFNEFSFSPNATSVLTWCPGGIQLLHLENHASPPSPDRTEPPRRGGQHLVAYSVGGRCIATARRSGGVVTILGHTSGIQQQSTDMSVCIRDIKIVNNAVFVTDGCKLVSWDPETGGMTRIDSGATQREVVDIQAHVGKNPFALSNDGSQLAFSVGRKVLLYDTKTQGFLDEHTAYATVVDVRFSPDGRKLWLITSNMGFDKNTFVQILCYLMTLEVTENRCFATATRKFLRDDWPWVNLFSSHGYHIGRGSGWISDSTGRKILWLPPSWRTKERADVRWDGDFLAFVGDQHPQPIIIEFKPPPLLSHPHSNFSSDV